CAWHTDFEYPFFFTELAFDTRPLLDVCGIESDFRCPARRDAPSQDQAGRSEDRSHEPEIGSGTVESRLHGHVPLTIKESGRSQVASERGPPVPLGLHQWTQQAPSRPLRCAPPGHGQPLWHRHGEPAATIHVECIVHRKLPCEFLVITDVHLLE